MFMRRRFLKQPHLIDDNYFMLTIRGKQKAPLPFPKRGLFVRFRGLFFLTRILNDYKIVLLMC